jgi:hypothetical protein
MKLHWFLIAFLFALSKAGFALQGNTPQTALEELATTNKPEVIARHLPEPVQKSIEVLPKPQKQQVMEKLVSMKSLQLEGCTVRRAKDADAWEIVDSKGASKGRVSMANAFVSGLDAMLPLQIESDDSSQTFIVTMHLEGDDWRLDGFGPWTKTDLGLHKLVHQPTEMEDNEGAAQETLHTLVRALNRYALAFPRIGFPSSLRVLTLPLPEDPALRYLASPLLDESFAADPLIKNGYQFLYVLTDTGSGEHGQPGEFEIRAVPVEFSKTGKKGYFTDRSGQIHVTDSNRPATEDDPLPEDE